MARYKYAASTGDFLIDVTTGRPAPNVEFSVYTAQTDGTKVTDLQDASGATITTSNPLKSDSLGFVQFFGPDGVRSDLWIDTGTGSRMLVRAATTYATSDDVTAAQNTADAAAAAAAAASAAASGALANPFTSSGQLVFGTGNKTSSVLPPGTADQFLQIKSGNTLQWTTIPAVSGGFSATSIADLPVGSVVQYLPPKEATSYVIPDGWLELNGSTTIKVSDYPELYALYGNTYGGTAGVTFGVPDARGKVLAGYKSSDSDFNAVGGPSADMPKTVTLLAANIPAHAHGMQHGHGTITTGSAQIAYRSSLNISAGTSTSPDPVVRGQDAGSSKRTIQYSDHTHTVSIGNTSSSRALTDSWGATTPQPFKILQPHLAVIHIVKAKMLAGSTVPAWVKNVDLPLTTLTGLTSTTVTDRTWSYDSGQTAVKIEIKNGATGSSFARPTDSSFSGGAGYAVQADFKFDTTEFATTPANKLLGVGFSTTEAATQTDGISVRISASGTVSAYNGASALSGLTVGSIASLAENTWYTLRLQYTGGCVMVYQISGTTRTLLLRTSPHTTSASTLHPNILKLNVYPFVVAESVSAANFIGYFRNFKAWSLETGNLS